jgi:cold shock CspA family protein
MHDDEDDYVEVYEMVGTVAEWDGRRGYILSEDGEHVSIYRSTWTRRPAFTAPLKVGDRIYCWVGAEVSYSLQRIRLIEPMEPDADHIHRLKGIAKRNVARQMGRFRAEIEFCDTFTGTIESYNARKKTGLIRRDDGERLQFDRYRFDSKRHKKIKPGMPVRFQACCFWGIWSVVDIVSIGEP